MNLHKIRLGAHSYRVHKQVPTADGQGHMSVPDGYEEVELDLVIDTDKLLRRLGHKAVMSKKGVTKLAGGAVAMKVVRRRREP